MISNQFSFCKLINNSVDSVTIDKCTLLFCVWCVAVMHFSFIADYCSYAFIWLSDEKAMG